ncbi:AfsR/SARP family transcriptional regulator [Pseudonocardiaceae bacterium YIM PH 21723]|nr:AfsR/SARP family transcriptional regulator [Pseudonocardiaceae bacterium YIM PH 21723]
MRFAILGPLSVSTDDGEMVRIPEHKVRALLAILLVHDGRTVSSAQLIAELWPDSRPENPARMLHTKVWQLRRALEQAQPGGRDLVVAQPPGYRLAPASDVLEFRELEDRAHRASDLRERVELLDQALGLWRGPVLADFPDQEWGRSLSEARLAAVEARAEARLELGEHDRPAGELGALLAEHPGRERLRLLHMRALQLAGRAGEALQSFDDHRRWLAAELGLEPGGELVRLRDEVLRHSPRPAPVRAPRVPLPAHRLVGRDADVAAVGDLLAEHRLVTLTGIGGVGKTRLATEIALGQSDEVWWAELTGAGSVAGRLAELLSVREADFDPRVLDGRRLLIVLDGAERNIDQVAELCARVLSLADGPRFLVTSQEPVRVDAERVYPVAPLDVEASARLFLARAPEASIDPVAVRAICRRLDGIPLALELAAARVHALGVRDVADRLIDRFALLTAGRRDAPARHRTLRAAIGWSWDLLGEPEQRVLRRLAVHTGGAALAAVELVSDPEQHGGVLDVLARLVDRSLVSTSDTASDSKAGLGRRYRLPESVAAYAVEQLRAAGELEVIRLRHAEYYTAMAASRHDEAWLTVLDAELTNLRTALDTLVAARAVEAAMRLVNALSWHWFLRGRFAEATAALDSVLELTGVDSEDRQMAVAWRAAFGVRSGREPAAVRQVARAWEQTASGQVCTRWFLADTMVGYGDQSTVRQWLDQVIADADRLGDRWSLAAALATRARLGLLLGSPDAVALDGERSAELFRELGDRWGQFSAASALATVAEIRADYPTATRLLREGLELARSMKLHHEVSIKLSGLGRIALISGDHAQATALHEQAREVAVEHHFTWGVQFAEIGLGMGARRTGDLDTAENYLRAWLDWCLRLDGAPGAALILAELGFVAELRGDPETARRLHSQGLSLAHQVGDRRAIALAFEGLAGVFTAQDRQDCAAQLLGAAAAGRKALGAPLPAGERGDVERITGLVRRKLGDANFRSEWERGRALSALPQRLDQAAEATGAVSLLDHLLGEPDQVIG